MTPAEVQSEYGIAVQTLANYRCQGVGPSYVKKTPGRGGRVVYRRAAIEAWLDARTVPTEAAA
ncbi:helix-turn-helix transcriptional regulator [Streptomyces sp. NPDC056503]|uniref:helix-turn-helix transcriptional regulator n=1 Tax=Streptomyces sp. NPDC056503 TaxID=3345842 RepID=UPI0036D1462F